LSDDPTDESRIDAATQPVLWSESYALGVAEVDRQHQALFDRVNAFFAAARSSGPRRALEEAIASLRTYAAHHFAEEEKLMGGLAYPGLESHAAAHRVLSRHLDGVASLLAEQGASVSAVVASAGLLRGWLLDHIVDEDGAFGAFARSRPRSPPR
jgi:hemerythrin-like metal-binding protein